MNIPGGRAAVDQCGVCGGDNSTCKDCKGTVNGNAKVDVCGVCGGDGTSCLGCDGKAHSGMVLDACGVCGGDGSSCKDCRGVPNGGMTIDKCGVCGGSNSTCLDCSGTVNGNAIPDLCGVCGGNNSTCVNGQSCSGVMDRCGVCNGSDLCVDCAGIPNGGTAIDCCGVCGGDGSSCADKCTYYHLSKEKAVSARTFRALFASVTKYSRQQMQCKSRQSASALTRIALAEKLVTQSNELLLNVIGDEIKVCDTVYCKKINLQQVLTTLNANLKRLYKLSRDAQYAAANTCGSTRALTTAPSTGKRLFTGAAAAIRRLPPIACNN